MTRHPDDPRLLPLVENISGTLAPPDPLVTGGAWDGGRCAYVVRRWRAGGPSPFCDAPAAARTAYCARHLERCRVAPGTAEGRRLARGQALAAQSAPPPPREFARLGAVALAEAPGESEGLQGLGLTLPRGDDP